MESIVDAAEQMPERANESWYLVCCIGGWGMIALGMGGGSEVDEFKYIGMALVGGAICGAFGSVMMVALVVVIINMSRSQRPPNPVRYS